MKFLAEFEQREGFKLEWWQKLALVFVAWTTVLHIIVRVEFIKKTIQDFTNLF